MPALQVNDTASGAGKNITPVMQVNTMQALQLRAITSRTRSHLTSKT